MARQTTQRQVTRTRSGRPIPTGLGVRPAFPAPTTPPVPGLASPVLASADVIAAAPAEPQYSVTIEEVIVGELADELCTLYTEAMSPLDEVAAMLHGYPREFLLDVFANPGYTKLIGWDADTPMGLAIMTKQLELVPEVSPAFLRNLFPEHADLDRIYYGLTVLVKPTRRGMSLFSRIYIEMWQIPARAGGVLVFDACKFNRENLAVDGVVDHIASMFPRSSWSIIDQHSWYAAELPEPLR